MLLSLVSFLLMCFCSARVCRRRLLHGDCVQNVAFARKLDSYRQGARRHTYHSLTFELGSGWKVPL
jgi:hypothetical protein